MFFIWRSEPARAAHRRRPGSCPSIPGGWSSGGGGGGVGRRGLFRRRRLVGRRRRLGETGDAHRRRDGAEVEAAFPPRKAHRRAARLRAGREPPPITRWARRSARRRSRWRRRGRCWSSPICRRASVHRPARRVRRRARGAGLRRRCGRRCASRARALGLPSRRAGAVRAARPRPGAGRNGVLLYVSLAERYARIVADAGLGTPAGGVAGGLIDELAAALRRATRRRR